MIFYISTIVAGNTYLLTVVARKQKVKRKPIVVTVILCYSFIASWLPWAVARLKGFLTGKDNVNETNISFCFNLFWVALNPLVYILSTKSVKKTVVSRYDYSR